MTHPIAEVCYLGFLLLTLASACVVAFSGHIVRSAFALLLTFFGAAGIYVFLRADFLAGTQLLVYVGGILVLLLFAVMLTSRIGDIRTSNESWNRGPAAFVSILAFLVLSVTGLSVRWPRHALPDAPTTAPLGESLLTTYLLPFEAISVLLLVVMVGAALVARRAPEPPPKGRPGI